MEELYQQLDLGGKQLDSIHKESWPKAGEITEEAGAIAVMVNGKLRSTIAVSGEQLGVSQQEIEKLAKTDPKIVKYLDGQTIKKVVFVPGKVINFVV